MLQKIGDSLKGHKWVAMVILGPLAVIFAVWGAYGIVNLDVGSSTYAAKADGETIPVEQARQAWSNQQAQWSQRIGQDIPEALQKTLQDQVLETLIRTSLLTNRSHKLGYRVSDGALLDAMHQEPAFQVDGKFSTEAARGRLAQAGISEGAYEADLRQALQRAQLQDGIRDSDFVTPAEGDRLNTLQREQREVRYAVFSADSFSGTAPIDDATLSEYYKRHEPEFRTPESVKLQYGELRLDQIAAQVQVTDADLKTYYDQNKDRFNVPEKRHAHHILIEIGSDAAAALKKAEDVYAQAKSGKDFEALARTYSADPGSASRGGDLGWSERGNYAAAFADALFAMKPGEIRGPVKTQYGYHIIRLDETQPGHGQTFDEARAEIDSSIRRDRAADKFGELQEKLQQRMEQSPGDLAAVAKEIGLATGEVAEFLRGEGGAPLGTSPELQQLVFSNPILVEHRLGGPVSLGEDRIVIVKVLEHHDAKTKPMSEVREQVISGVRKERGTKASLQAAQEAAKKLESGADFDAAVKGLPVKAEPAKFVGRTEEGVPGPVLQTAFSGSRPDAQHPLVRAIPSTDGGAVLVEVTNGRVEPATQGTEQQARNRQDAGKQGMADMAAYVEEVRRTAKVEKNAEVFN